MLQRVERRYLKGDKESWFKSNFKKDTMMLFLFDENIISTTPDIQVRNKYLILKRYDLSIQNLDNINWIITYP